MMDQNSHEPNSAFEAVAHVNGSQKSAMSEASIVNFKATLAPEAAGGRRQVGTQAPAAPEVTALEALDAVRAKFMEWKASHEKLYRALWTVREQGALLDRAPEARLALAGILNKDPRIGASHQYKTEGKSGAELLLVDELGLDKGSEKSRYLAVIEASKKAVDVMDEDTFLAWLTSNGGITSVAVSQRKAPRPSTPFDVESYISNRDSHQQYVIGYRQLIDPKFRVRPHTFQGISLWVVRSLPSGSLQLIEAITKPPAVANLMQKIIPVAYSIAEEEEKKKKNKDALADAFRNINRTALRLAGGLKAEPAARWAEKFETAIEKIYQLQPEFFSAAPKVRLGSNTQSIEVVHEDWDVLDPGRFVENARQGELICYPYHPDRPEENLAAAKKWAKKRGPLQDRNKEGLLRFLEA